ncbi:hypothetical protein E2C01_007827 [Portunus trituberculatus]|uniref:Uncharacterized protein n=1 Tax=Portunus trituberculatus TaxID=210409 RepID=A0A5B7D4V4_PORTR|nr:hypothetical protein [Portunus trituberculatus]
MVCWVCSVKGNVSFIECWEYVQCKGKCVLYRVLGGWSVLIVAPRCYTLTDVELRRVSCEGRLMGTQGKVRQHSLTFTITPDLETRRKHELAEIFVARCYNVMLETLGRGVFVNEVFQGAAMDSHIVLGAATKVSDNRQHPTPKLWVTVPEEPCVGCELRVTVIYIVSQPQLLKSEAAIVIYMLLLLESLIDVGEDNSLNDTHSRHRPIDVTPRSLYPILLLCIVPAGEVRPEGKSEHGQAVQEEFNEDTGNVLKGIVLSNMIAELNCAIKLGSHWFQFLEPALHEYA